MGKGELGGGMGGRGAEAAIAALGLGGAEGAEGALEERGGVAGFGGHNGGGANGDGGGGFRRVVHGFDDLFADMVRARRERAGEQGAEDAGTWWHDAITGAGAVDADGSLEVAGDFLVGGGVLVECHEEERQWFSFGGAAVPLAAEFLREWREGSHGCQDGEFFAKERAKVSNSSSGRGWL